MMTPKEIEIDGFKVAPKDHIAVRDVDLAYFGPYERRAFTTNSNDIKAPFGCE